MIKAEFIYSMGWIIYPMVELSPKQCQIGTGLGGANVSGRWT